MSGLDGSLHAEVPEGWTLKRVNLKGLFTELSKAAVKIGGGLATVGAAAHLANPTQPDPTRPKS